MQQLKIIICKDEFFVFDGTNQISIDGNLSFEYSMNRVQEDVARFLERLAYYYNLSGSSELSVLLVANEDDSITKTVANAFDGQEKAVHREDVCEIDRIITDVIRQLSNDKTQHIDEFGVNFDGINYMLKNNTLEKQPFSLLGLTIGAAELANHIERSGQ